MAGSTESAPVTSPPIDASDALAALSATDRAHWRMTGELPAPNPPDVAAASSPAEPVEQVVSTETSVEAASEAAEPLKPKTAERFDKLLTELKTVKQQRESDQRELERVRAELATLRTPQPRADAKPASSPGPEPFEKFAQWSLTHPDAEFEDYLTARDVHVEAQRTAKAQADHAAQEFKRSLDEADRILSERTSAEYAADPTLHAKAAPVIEAFTKANLLVPIERYPPGTLLQPGHVFAAEVARSERPIALLMHLYEHQAEVQRLLALPKPELLVRELAKLDLSLSGPRATPVTKTTSTAPAPATTLGSKTTLPADEAVSAVKAGDFRRYRDVQNARELAAR